LCSSCCTSLLQTQYVDGGRTKGSQPGEGCESLRSPSPRLGLHGRHFFFFFLVVLGFFASFFAPAAFFGLASARAARLGAAVLVCRNAATFRAAAAGATSPLSSSSFS